MPKPIQNFKGYTLPDLKVWTKSVEKNFWRTKS